MGERTPELDAYSEVVQLAGRQPLELKIGVRSPASELSRNDRTAFITDTDQV